MKLKPWKISSCIAFAKADIFLNPTRENVDVHGRHLHYHLVLSTSKITIISAGVQNSQADFFVCDEELLIVTMKYQK